MHFSYIKGDKEIKNWLKRGNLNRKRCMHRPLACSFKNSYSLVKSREELVAENENAEETQEKEQVETENQVNNNTENETQSVEASECSSLTEEDQVVTEEKVALDLENVSECQSVSRDAMEEFQYKPASIPATRRFPVGVTYVDSQGYIYAQEVKEGEDYTSTSCVFHFFSFYRTSKLIHLIPVIANSLEILGLIKLFYSTDSATQCLLRSLKRD